MFLRVGNLDHDTVAIDLSSVQRVRPPDGAEGARTSVRPGDILLSITAEVGMVGLVSENLGEAYVNQHVALLRPLPSVYPAGFAYSLIDPHGLQAAARLAQYGATKQGLGLDQVRGFEVPVPPLPEQHRIVEAIESYISRIDSAVETLKRVQTNLKRYRASVLKAAVEGRLVPTEAELAREEGRDYEPASVLLDRILKERRRRWEESGRKGKYEEPTTPDISGLPELPEGWCWATVEQLACDVRYGTSAKTEETLTSGVPVLRMGNIVDGELDFSSLKYLPAEHEEFPELLLHPGDLLFNRTNSAELVGKCAVFRAAQVDFSCASYLIRVRFFFDVTAEYVAAFINSAAGRAWASSVAVQQVGQANVNGTKLKALVVPVPPAAEQVRIVAEMDRAFSVLKASLMLIYQDQARCIRLRQSILKWAFEGKLVDQDPADEPAEVLLARIRAERVGQPQGNGKRGRGRPKGTDTASPEQPPAALPHPLPATPIPQAAQAPATAARPTSAASKGQLPLFDK
ncbi:MAG: restriction endonuclease subunit S [Myxococcota bacterium]|jgi:type I restriction enzyme S subunit|nr:restriction endonuclease subunit S [Myxococcota bacterium]